VHRARTAGQRHKRAAAVARIRRKPCLIVDAETGVTFGRLAGDLDARGRPSVYHVQDLWLAALAIQHNLKILTGNAKDFQGIPGLTVLSVPG
jgi:predicted nucleic acid-binding protein